MSDIIKIARAVSVDEIDITIDESCPFPEYELEVWWHEWVWNDARTKRLESTYVEGISINPVDHLDEGGNIDKESLYSEVLDVLLEAYTSDNRVGNIRVVA